MKNKLLSILILSFVTLFVYHLTTFAGITGKISGVITDASTREPLPAVNVVIEGTTLGGATDNDGHFFIINIPPGTYSLQASMVGYSVEIKTGVIVNVDHTTPVNFDLRVTTIAGEEVTVTAEREIVPMDISASHIVADAEQIVEVPLVNDIRDFINLQAGVSGLSVRGGGSDQTQFMMDGLMMVDNRSNRPLMMVNLSTVKELNIIKGGFNAEYGNVRSGLINVVTREGSPSVYHGSVDIRRMSPGLKHGGSSMFSPDCYYLRSYLDDDVCWEGTKNGPWDDYTQLQYPEFDGWNARSKDLLEDDDPTNNRTPEECRDLFLWNHRAEGSGALGQKEGKYGHKPDWNADLGFGGPVPGIGKYLGNLSFYASYRNNREMFVFPVSREFYLEQNAQLKLTSRLSPSMKLTVEGFYGDISTIAKDYDGGSDNRYATSGSDLFNSDQTNHEGTHNIKYYPAALKPFDIYRSMFGLSFDHVLSPRTFYNIRISSITNRNDCGSYGPDDMRDPTIIKNFGSTPVTEQPYGFEIAETVLYMQDGMSYATNGGGAQDSSEVCTLNFKFDLTSQIDRYNQVKFGLMFNYDDLYTRFRRIRYESYYENDTASKWRHYPYRIGAYIQNKLEFEGMIANFGIRLDYNEPNCDWYTVERYSKYFRSQYIDTFEEVTPSEPTKGHLKISPRLGVSHPISENSKLYFNYGHFYSMPSSTHMYQIYWSGPEAGAGITRLGNPSADLPQTVSYELGVEHNFRNLFLIHLAGYYKDVRNQTGYIYYTSFDESVDYRTTDNNHYADIRGFELRLEKRFGRWITGWLNYNYMVTTNGYIGREHYYEDPRLQMIYGLQNPYQQRPIARPLLRYNLRIRSPRDWGPSVGYIKPLGDLQLGLLFYWRAGSYMTWDPLTTYELNQNLQWRDNYSYDARFSKRLQFGKYNINIFADIKNLFNMRRLNTRGFADSDDQRNYYESLRLPMYEDEIYQNAGYTPGNDRPGDVRSDEKPYIDMPNRDCFTYSNVRAIFLGLKIDF
jgi:hypothetical protein